MEEKRKDLNSFFYEQASKLARIGSWEFDVRTGEMHWSTMVHELHETDPATFTPDLASSVGFYRKDFRVMINESLEKCIKTGLGFDFEAVITTQKNKELWTRAIGNAEMYQGNCVRVYGSLQDIHRSKILELQMREILGSISDAFYAVDNHWNFTYFNKEAENLLLKKADDVLGKNIWELFPAAVDTQIWKVFQRVARTKKKSSIEYHYPGDEKWYEINVYPSHDGVSAYFKNIDERKQAEERLEKAYQEKINVLESIGDAFFNVDSDWIVTYLNKETERVLGKNRADIVGKNLWEVYPDVVDTGFYRRYHEAMVTQENLRFEEFYPALHMWIEVAVYPSPNSLSVYFRDITGRKESEIRVRQSNERFEKVTEATNDAIWDWNVLENTLYWGAGFNKLFGYQTEKITPTLESWTSHVHPEDLQWVMESLHRALEKSDETNWTAEYRYQKSDGTFADVIDRGIVLRNEAGAPARVVGAMNDITERKHFEITRSNYVRQIELQNEKLKSIAWTQSHIVRAPLSRMLSIINVIEDPKSNDDILMWLKHLRQSAHELDEIIKDIVNRTDHLD